MKKRVNSKLNADRSHFLESKTVKLVLGLYVQHNIIQNNSRPKLIAKLFIAI